MILDEISFMETFERFFTEEEVSKIEFTSFIHTLFKKYEHLYLIRFNFYNNSVVKEGKFQNERISLNLLPVMEYNHNYYKWFEGGVAVYNDKKMVLKTENFLSKFFSYLNPINYYVQYKNNQLTYRDFEAKILSHHCLKEEKWLFLCKDNKDIVFCKESLEKDINNFLGKNILIKQHSYQLNHQLMPSPTSRKLVKI